MEVAIYLEQGVIGRGSTEVECKLDALRQLRDLLARPDAEVLDLLHLDETLDEEPDPDYGYGLFCDGPDCGKPLNKDDYVEGWCGAMFCSLACMSAYDKDQPDFEHRPDCPMRQDGSYDCAC